MNIYLLKDKDSGEFYRNQNEFGPMQEAHIFRTVGHARASVAQYKRNLQYLQPRNFIIVELECTETFTQPA